ncbi:MAG: ATP-binding protein [Gammaproteobacteria bacterium]|jgi:SpoVK/Ycf46/Vps4 family AAA+-type ATPase
MALKFYSLLFLGICLSGKALAFEQYKTAPKPVFEKSYGHLLVGSNDIKLSARTRTHIRKLAARIKKNRRGACVLFTGPEGTGKIQAVTMLGVSLDLSVFRVDLSAVVSKYIGETEKNLARVFKHAESRHWILLFDEADSLFGKRTGISDAHDRDSNLETGYLLRLLERHHGLVVLTTNQRSNVDPTFKRRCRYEIKFQ